MHALDYAGRRGEYRLDRCPIDRLRAVRHHLYVVAHQVWGKEPPQAQVRDVVFSAELEGVHDEALVHHAQRIVTCEVGDGQKSDRSHSGRKPQHVARRLAQSLCTNATHLDAERDQGQARSDQRERAVVLLKQHRQTEQQARENKVPASARCVKGKQTLESSQGKQHRKRRVEGKRPGRKSPNGRHHHHRDARQPSAPAADVRRDSVREPNQDDIANDDRKPRNDHTGFK